MQEVPLRNFCSRFPESSAPGAECQARSHEKLGWFVQSSSLGIPTEFGESGERLFANSRGFIDAVAGVQI